TVTMVGGGANLLVRDEGIPGLVVHLSGPGFQTFKPAVPGTGTVPGTDVLVGAALPLEWLIRRAQEASLSGVEFLAGVPGHVGGAVRMNAGTHDDEGKFHHFGDRVRELKVMDLAGQVKTLLGEAAGFGYRSSSLSGWIVLEALLRFTPDDAGEIAARVQRLWVFKKQTQDWSAPSAGCIFKNPKDHSAGWMVDQAGMKGFRIGGAVVSPRHANFILNEGNARAADVLALVEEARARVLKQFGVQLETEVQIL
ncbi:MAG: UDP-N-acetylmuramate dehydrogenase, partial [Candidatus Omnitrophota bacterium]|nr:UDP-N-acetylmuramate dehydrogenase [Candidatus Omnitrophota bacterium]